MRTPISLLLASAIGLAASLHVSAANAGGLYVGISAPVVVAAPVVTPVVVAPAITDAVVAPVAVEYDPTVIVGTDYYCCGPGWHGYNWRGYGWHGYGERGYVHPGFTHVGAVHAPPARVEARRGRR
jgi:hypothetical protein